MTVHLLPGLGATSALYSGYDFPFPVRRVEYGSPPHPGCTFAEYAQFLIRENHIRPGDSAIGVSLGGMMACEISKWVPLTKITLISSCTTRSHLTPVAHRLAFLGPRLPWELFRRLSFPLPGLDEPRKKAMRMFRDADSGFVRWACSRAAAWEGLEHHPDWFRIQGDRDPIFPIRLQQVEHVIPGGKHLMVISRRDEILPLLVARHSAKSGQAFGACPPNLK